MKNTILFSLEHWEMSMVADSGLLSSASDITQVEKSWMSRLRNPKRATIGRGGCMYSFGVAHYRDTPKFCVRVIFDIYPYCSSNTLFVTLDFQSIKGIGKLPVIFRAIINVSLTGISTALAKIKIGKKTWGHMSLFVKSILEVIHEGFPVCKHKPHFATSNLSKTR